MTLFKPIVIIFVEVFLSEMISKDSVFYSFLTNRCFSVVKELERRLPAQILQCQAQLQHLKLQCIDV